MTERLIERSFPIVQLNPLSVRERNAFKPVYKMHKWFARRSSSIFRAILLGAALPAEQDGRPVDLMKEFYEGHGDDPRLKRADGTPLRVLDPFMGGGTTVVEALRLGFDVTGNDYNPIAWFIVKGETTPVDLEELDAAYQRVADKVKDELLDLYKTTCPVTGKDADIIYGFWVKQGICVDPSCGAVTDLFKSYEVARKRGDATITYVSDVKCPHCSAVFDWELNRATVTAGGPQVLGEGAPGKGRPAAGLFAFSPETSPVDCPNCLRSVPISARGKKKAKKKNVALHVLVDPSTGDFFEIRGTIPKEVRAPESGFGFYPAKGPAKGGKFACEECGRTQPIVESARAQGRPLPFRYYGYYAHTPCRDMAEDDFESHGLPTNNDKWFGAVCTGDLERVAAAEETLAGEGAELPLPRQGIYDGYNTNRLVIHQYARWTDLFGSRQVLALGKLLAAIADERDPVLRNALLSAFQSTLDSQSQIVGYHAARNMQRGVQAAHDYRNPSTCLEVNTWGLGGTLGSGAFSNCYDKVAAGLAYRDAPDLFAAIGYVEVADRLSDAWAPRSLNGSATELESIGDRSVDLVVTDPPYAGSVQYAEMSDWGYVWLHQVLKGHYPDEFGPELTLKSQEIIEDGKHKDVESFPTNREHLERRVVGRPCGRPPLHGLGV